MIATLPRMKAHLFSAAGVLLIALALMPWSKSRQGPPEPSDPARPAPSKSSGPARRETPSLPSAQEAMAPLEPTELAGILQRIEDAVTSYDPAGVKVLKDLLLDSHVEVRTAAREAMVQLGETDGIPVLRQAATRMQDPAEARACREAADFLELPSWSDTQDAREATAELRGENEPPPP